MGDWNEGYLNYNCYAFSIDLVNWRHPDGSSEYDVSKPVSVIADDVISDLNSLGYWGCKAMTKPSSLPDKYFKLICVGKNTNYESEIYYVVYKHKNGSGMQPYMAF